MHESAYTVICYKIDFTQFVTHLVTHQ